jgi:signal transduction histidine kinase
MVKSKTGNPYYHILFWLVVMAILIVVFGKSWQNSTQAFYFVSLFLPVIMATSYFFNYYLVPEYLLKRRYWLFTVYFYFTIVSSLFLEMVVLIFSFIYLASFDLNNFDLNSSDIILLAVVMYLVVFLGSFLLMVQQFFENKKELENLKIEKEKTDEPYLELTSNRKLARIPFGNIEFIESLTDYVVVHTADGKEIKSKVKISTVEQYLPHTFLRIHRSFIVNKKKITSYNSNKIEIGGVELNIGRSYKQQVSKSL